MFANFRRSKHSQNALGKKASLRTPRFEVLEERSLLSTITLNFNSLPSAQGWTYVTISSLNADLPGRRNANNEPLFENSMGVLSFPSTDGNQYQLSGALDPSIKNFELRIRVAVTAEESNANHSGFQHLR